MNIKTSVRVEKNVFAEKGAHNGNKKMITKACELIVAQAKRLSPVDKAQLENSIMYKTVQEEGGFNKGKGEQAPESQKIDLQPKGSLDGKYYEGYVGTNSDHWFPEFGTRYQKAQPFMRPAKEIVLDGRGQAEIAKKYGVDEMKKAFALRKKVIKNG